MKIIIAVIKPFKIEEVTDALNEVGHLGRHAHRGAWARPSDVGTPRCTAAPSTASSTSRRSASRSSCDDADVDKIVDRDRRERADRERSATASTG